MYKDIKDQLVESAYELFKEKGYEQTTVMDICKKCGVTKTTFYRYISSKEDLLAHFFNNINNDASELLLSMANAENYWEMICNCFEIILNQAIRIGPQLYSQLYVANLKENRGTFDTQDLFDNLVITLIEKAQKADQIQSRRNSKDLYIASANLCFGCGIQWCLHNGKTDFKKEFFDSLAILLDVNEEKIALDL